MAPAFASWRALGSRSARAAVKKVLVLEDDDVYRVFDDDDDVYYYIRWRLKLEGETENMGVCTKERKGITAAVLMATPCTNSSSSYPRGNGATILLCLLHPAEGWQRFPCKHDVYYGRWKSRTRGPNTAGCTHTHETSFVGGVSSTPGVDL